MLWRTLRKLRSSKGERRAAGRQDPESRRAAVDALAVLNDPGAAAALRLATQDSDLGGQGAAALDLKSIGFQSGRMEDRAAAAVLAGDFAAAVALGEAAITPLIEALKSGEAGFVAAQRRRQAAHALAQLRPKGKRAVKCLLHALSDDPCVGEEAAHALVAIGPPAVGGLISTVANFWTSNRVESCLAATALGAIGDVRAAKRLAEAVAWANRYMEGSPTGRVARCAASALKILLAASSASFSEADLRFVVDLPDGYRVEAYGDGEPPDKRIVLDLDCSEIRDLARKELTYRETRPGL